MSESDELISALKKALKMNGLTYSDVAEPLGLTASSVKRLFSEKSFSLKRLESVCEVAGITLSDLFQSMQAEKRYIEELTLEQEEEVATNKKLLLVLFLVLNRYTFDEILAQYSLKETECIQLLARLDKLALIELLPNNRIKLQIGPNFSWRANGPIQKFFKAKIQQDFFDSNFAGEDETLVEINGLLTDESNAVIRKKLEELGAEFSGLAESDSSRPIKDRQVNSLVLAVRAWQIPLFDDLRRN